MAENNNPEQQLEQMAQELRNEIEELINQEQAIGRNFEGEVQRLRENVLPEMKDVIQTEQHEEQGLEDIQSHLQKIHSDIQQVANDIQEGHGV